MPLPARRDRTARQIQSQPIYLGRDAGSHPAGLLLLGKHLAISMEDIIGLD